MCSPHNESKSIFAESSIRTFKGKICKKITANDTKSYNSYLDKLVDKYNNTCIVFLLAKKRIEDNYSALTEKIKLSHKAPKFRVGDRVRIAKYKSFFIC